MRFPAVATGILIVGLVLRFGFLDPNAGRSFAPAPDALEYAALAAELQASGEYKLHIAEHALQPRYAPGWPILLSLGVACGLRGEDLLVIPPIVSCLFAVLLAWITLLIFRHALDPAGDRPGLGLFAAAIAGLGWVCSPMPVAASGVLMSDEAAALCSTGGLALLAIGFTGQPKARAWLFSGGLALALSVAIRTVNVGFAAGPVLCFAIAGASRHGTAEAARRLLFMFAGALPVVGYVILVLMRSGFDPWQWSNYGFWHAGKLLADFSLANALEDPRNLGMGGVEFVARSAAGLHVPFEPTPAIGVGWPIAGWLAGVFVAAAAYRKLGKRRVVWFWIVVALAGWLCGQILLYATYAYYHQRFLLACMPWPWIFTALACAGAWRIRRLRPWVVIGLCAAGTTVWMTTRTVLGTVHPPSPIHDQARAQFTAWTALSDDQREALVMPFDPVRIQALGLLTPEVRRGIGTWGRLPTNTLAMPDLLFHGIVPAYPTEPPQVRAKPAEPLFVPQAAELVGDPALWFEESAGCYVLECRAFDGTPRWTYRIPLPTIGDERVRVEGPHPGITMFAADPWKRGDPPSRTEPIEHYLDLYRSAVVLRRGRTMTVARLVGECMELHIVDGAQYVATEPRGLPTPTRTLRTPGFGATRVWRSADGTFFSKLRSPTTVGEVVYLTASRRLRPCLPMLDRPTSPFRLRESRPAVRSPAAQVAQMQQRLRDAGFADVPILTPEQPLEPDAAWAAQPGPTEPLTLRGTSPEIIAPGPALRSLAPRVGSMVGDIKRGVDRGRSLALALALGRRALMDPIDLDEIARNTWLLSGISRAAASSEIERVTYLEANGTSHDLESALHAGIDLRSPRIRLEYANGLTVRVNLSGAPWTVPHDGDALALPQNGFVASVPDGVQAMRATHPRTGRLFEFATDPGHGQMLHGCGEPCRYGGLESVDGGLRIVKSALGDVRTLRIDTGGVTQLDAGRPVWFARALLERRRDTVEATLRARWKSDDPGILHIDGHGVLFARGEGHTKIHAVVGRHSTSATISVTKWPKLDHWTRHFVDQDRMVLSFTSRARLERAYALAYSAAFFTVGPRAYAPDPGPLHHRFVVRVHNTVAGNPVEVQAAGSLRSGKLVTGDPESILPVPR